MRKKLYFFLFFLVIANIALLTVTLNHHNFKCSIDVNKIPIVFNVNQESNWSHFCSFLRDQYANGVPPDREIIINNNKSYISLSQNYIRESSKHHYYIHFEDGSIKCYSTTFRYPAFDKENDSWYFIALDCFEHKWFQINKIVELINKEDTQLSLSASSDFKFNSNWEHLKYFFQNITKHKLISVYSNKLNIVTNEH